MPQGLFLLIQPQCSELLLSRSWMRIAYGPALDLSARAKRVQTECEGASILGGDLADNVPSSSNVTPGDVGEQLLENAVTIQAAGVAAHQATRRWAVARAAVLASGDGSLALDL